MLYKITLAAERDALPTILDLLSDAAQRGGISQSFVVECQPEAKDARPAPTPTFNRLPEPKRAAKPKRLGRSRSGDPGERWFLVRDKLLDKGALGYGEIADVFAAGGFKRTGVGSAVARWIKLGVLKKVATGRYALVEPEASAA